MPRLLQKEKGTQGTKVVESALPKIRVHVVHGDIGKIGEGKCVPASERLPIDAVAVGHYAGVEPRDAELALDRSISLGDSEDAPRELVITGLTRRNTLRGDLGIPFFLPDPRRHSGGRVIVVAGMGTPGRFGEPELTMLARELCWCLSRMSKHHLATVLIGAGNGNLNLVDAAEAWLRGIREGLFEFPEGKPCLEAITFVEFDSKRSHELNSVLRARPVEGLEVEIGPLTRFTDERGSAASDSKKCEHQAHLVNHFNVAYSARRWWFTLFPPQGGQERRSKAVRKRDLKLRLDRLANASRLDHQRTRGAILSRDLFPKDLWKRMDVSAPVMVVCRDGTVANVPWEMVAVSPEGSAGPVSKEPESWFLGISRGLTRSLAHMRPGAPTLASRTRLRVLVIADGCREHPLNALHSGAHHLLQLFKRSNEQARTTRRVPQIEAKALIGPDEATRKRVLKELRRSDPYDLVYYGGHGEYDEDNPGNSGWIFSGGERVSAEDLQRIGAIPKFVFSNACETGRFSTAPFRRRGRHARSFAEVVLNRGAANLVCAAWPIGNKEAAAFAVQLFRNLLGVEDVESPQCMYVAMQAARKTLLNSGPDGAEAWGAYQHYGDPYFQLIPQKRGDEPASATTEPKLRQNTNGPE